MGFNLLSGPAGAQQADFLEKQIMSTVFGEQVVGERRDKVSISFTFGPDGNNPRIVQENFSGTGTVSNSDSFAIASVGTGVGLAELFSLNSVRYRAGHEIHTQFTFLITGNEAGVDTKIGLMDSDDGFAFGYQGTVFGIWYKRAGVENFIPQSSWNRNKLDGTNPKTGDLVLDPSKVQLGYISFGYLGIAPPFFSFYTNKHGWILAHVFDTVNVLDTTVLGNPYLPVRMSVERVSGTGTDIQIKSGSWRAGVVGEEGIGEGDLWFSTEVLDFPVTAADQVAVFTLRNKTTFKGKNNHLRAELGVANFVNDTNKDVIFRGIVNATIATPPTFADINTASSFMQVGFGGGIASGGVRGPATIILKGTDRRTDVLNTGIHFFPGQDFTLSVQPVEVTGIAGSIRASFRWREEH